jgi:hypothetical protein
MPAANRRRNTTVPFTLNSPIIQPATSRIQKPQNAAGAKGFISPRARQTRRAYSVTTAVPLADTMSMPLFAPSTS